MLAAGLILPVAYSSGDTSVFLLEVEGDSPTFSFCQLRFYEEDEGRLLCNWAVNFRYACFVSHPNNKILQAGSKIAEPEVVGECDDGEPIIKLLHY